MKKIETVAIVGMGALGLLFGDEIQTTLGRGAVRYVADAERVARYRESRFTVNGVAKQFDIVADTEAEPADLVLVAVKATALEASLAVMQTSVGPDTTIVSVLNGISSEEIIGARYGKGRIVYAVAQGMDAMKSGPALTYTKPGGLNIGNGPETEPGRLAALEAFFTRAGVPYTHEEDILHRMWAKFMLNVGINQCCMAFETTYGGVLNDAALFETLNGAMREVQALAACEGVDLSDEERLAYIELIRTLSPDGAPSMRQDGMAHRKSEVELFAGTVCRMAAAHGLSVPVNKMLYRRIQAMESTY